MFSCINRKTNISFRLIFIGSISVLSFAVTTRNAHGQDSLSSDELFAQARQAAFDQKNYEQAKALSLQALKKAPDYSDIRIFLGRLYSWTNRYDSARAAFGYVISRHPDNEDASAALTDLEYWNNHDEEALQECERGLGHHPQSQTLLLKKAKILKSLQRYSEAWAATDSLLTINPKNDAARSLMNSIQDNSSRNKIGIGYDFVYFDKQFSDPWHLVSLSYTRQTKLGSVIGRINYANRFATNGLQGEIDFYPHISKTFYAYLNVGLAGKNSVFPQYRAGASLYANIPWSMEAELGSRYLHFSSDVWMYTASLGKYYKNFWFNFRTYLVPDKKNISQSYTLTARYYTGGTDDYWSLSAGTGISPDDRPDAALLGLGKKLKAQKIGAGYSRVLKKLNILRIDLTWYHQEYQKNIYGSQWDAGISYQRRF